MSEIITPSVAARLRFFVTDPTTGVGVTGLTHSTITTAGYATEANGVRSATTSVTLTSTAATTAALATGQVIEYGLGQYGIDVPAVGTSGLIFAVVTVTGKDVRAVRHSIDVAVSSRLAPAVSGRTLNVNPSGEGDAVLNTEGRTAIADAVDTKLSDTHGDGSWGGGGGSGGGSPVFTAVVVARIATGSAAGWPEDFTIGDAYLTENAGAQPLFIKDVADNILSGLGTKNFSDPDFVGALRLAPLTDGTRTLDTPPTTIEVKSTDDVGIVYNDDTAGAEYFELQIPRAKTLMGVTKTKYSCQFIMNWGIDNTFERTVNLGEIKFLRKNAPAT